MTEEQLKEIEERADQEIHDPYNEFTEASAKNALALIAYIRELKLKADAYDYALMMGWGCEPPKELK